MMAALLSRNTALLLSLLALFPGATPSPARAEGRSALETLQAFVGTWDMELMTDKETFGDRGGPGTGTMTCAWGPMQAWVDCELDSEYAGLGRYVLKIVLYRTGNESRLGAFVTNSFGGGRLFLGQWNATDQLVFQDAWVDPARKWEYQRTTYEFLESGEVRFAIEVSTDDAEYLPHSRGIYHPR